MTWSIGKHCLKDQKARTHHHPSDRAIDQADGKHASNVRDVSAKKEVERDQGRAAHQNLAAADPLNDPARKDNDWYFDGRGNCKGYANVDRRSTQLQTRFAKPISS